MAKKQNARVGRIFKSETIYDAFKALDNTTSPVINPSSRQPLQLIIKSK